MYTKIFRSQYTNTKADNFIILYDGERRQPLSKIEARYNGFLSLDISQMWSFLLSNEDCQCLTWCGKYLYDAFEIRNRYIASISDGNVLWADVNMHRSRFCNLPCFMKQNLRILIILHVRTLPIKLHICMYFYIFVYVPTTPLMTIRLCRSRYGRKWGACK